MKAIKLVWFWLTRYMVVAEWRDNNKVNRKVHWAETERDALEWMACYPVTDACVYGKRGKLLGGRSV
jgi:hypothetical protein